MKIEIWPKFGPLNSHKIFDCFIQSLRNNGEQLFVNENANADVAVIWSVLWQGRGTTNVPGNNIDPSVSLLLCWKLADLDEMKVSKLE